MLSEIEQNCRQSLTEGAQGMAAKSPYWIQTQRF